MKFFIGTHITFKVDSNVEITYVNPVVVTMLKYDAEFFAKYKYCAANLYHTIGKSTTLYIASNPIKTSGFSGNETFVMSHLRFGEKLDVNEIDSIYDLLKNFHPTLVSALDTKGRIHQFTET